ncbi:lipoprotein [Salmonella enterica subsp. enterica serovar Choleraesuis]|nr:lipoprotein [Salmonella enterica subsp. enterica serovar Choleraesuis]
MKLLPIIALLLAGCSLPKTPEVVGGSQTSGIVRLGYDLPLLQRAVIDEELATRTAARQCQSWGYGEAVPFGAPINHCALISGSGCINQQIVMEYQCRGVNTLTPPPAVW